MTLRVTKRNGKVSEWWKYSGTIVTFLSLIVLPLVVIVSQFIYDETLQNYFAESPEVRIYFTFISFLQYIVFAFVIFVYPPYPAPFISAETYFKNRGFDKAVREYDWVKRFLYVSVPILIVLSILIPYFIQVENLLHIDLGKLSIPGHTYTVLQGYFFLVVLAGLFKMMFAVLRKEFHLYIAKGCLSILEEKKEPENEVENMGYLIRGLNSYNRYLNKRLKLHIQDLNKVSSIISTSPREEKKVLIHDILGAFKKTDTLEPLRCIYGILTDVEKKEEFLIEEPLINKVKEWGAITVTIIPVGFTVVDHILNSIHRGI